MRREQQTVAPKTAPLIVNGEEAGGGRHPECQKIAALVKRGGMFFPRMLVLLLPLVFLSASHGEEKEKELAREPRSRVFTPRPVRTVAFTPDGRSLIWGSWELLQVWGFDVDTERQFTMWKGEHVKALSPDGTMIALDGSKEEKEAIDAIRNSKDLTEADKEKTIEMLDLRRTGDTFVAIRKWKTGELVSTLKSKRMAFGFGAFSPDGKTVITMGTVGYRRMMSFWELPSGKLRRSIEVEKAWTVLDLQFSPDGKTVATGGHADGEESSEPFRIVYPPAFVALWDVACGKRLATFKGMKGYIYSVAFSPDSKLLAVGGNIGKEINEIIVWDVAKKERRATLTGHRGSVAAVAFSHDGKLLASAGGELRLWDVKTFRDLRNLTGHAGLTSIAFSPDDRMLASGSTDGTVRLWDLYKPAKGRDEKNK